MTAVVDEIFKKNLLAALQRGEWYWSREEGYIVVPTRAIASNKQQTSFYKILVATYGLGRYATTSKNRRTFKAFFLNVEKLIQFDERFAEFFAKIKREKENAAVMGVSHMTAVNHLPNNTEEVIFNED